MSKSTSSSQDPAEVRNEIIDYIDKESKIDPNALIKKINDANFDFWGQILLVMEALAEKKSSAISKDDFVKILNAIELKDNIKDDTKRSCIGYLFNQRISEINFLDAENIIEDLKIKDEKVNSSIMDDYNSFFTVFSNKKAKHLEEGIKALENAGADFKAMVQRGDTHLHIAAEMGRTDIIKLLIDGGKNVNAKNNEGKTALFLANPLGEGIKTLIKAGANINELDNNDKTPLHHSAQNYSPAELKALIELGADVRAKDNKGNTPLNVISKNLFSIKAPQMVELLLDHGADLEENLYEMLSRSQAVKKIIDDFKEKSKAVNAIDSDGKTPLHYAAILGKNEAIDELKRLGADLNAKDKLGNTPLHYAAREDHIESTKTLKKLGADVNAVNKLGNTPLHIATLEGHTESAKLLLGSGAHVKARNLYGLTPLHCAAENGDIEGIKVLINAKDDQGKTSIHYAAQKRDIETFKALIKLGADVNAQDIYGLTALHHASEQGNFGIIKALKGSLGDLNAKDKIGNTPLHYAVQTGDIITVNALIDLGTLDISAQNNKFAEEYAPRLDLQFETPLHIAIRKGNNEIARLLINLGADLKIKTFYGENPLHYAAQQGNVEILKALIESGGVEVDVKTDSTKKRFFPEVVFNKTPLHFAAENGHIEVVKELINLGAKVNACDDRGVTPLNYATKNGHTEIVDLIKAKQKSIDESRGNLSETPTTRVDNNSKDNGKPSEDMASISPARPESSPSPTSFSKTASGRASSNDSSDGEFVVY
jgi:ankyrin repeat protein